MVFFIGALLLFDLALKKVYYKKIISGKTRVIKWVMPFVLIVAFVVSVISFLVLPRNFRYLDVGISESDSFFPLLVYTILPSFNKFFLFYHIFFGQFPFHKKYDFIKYLIVAALFFSANGTNTFIVFLIGLLYVLFPKMIRKGIFIDKNNITNFFLKPILIIAVVIAFVYPLAIIFGQSVKTGQSFDESFQKVNSGNSEDISTIQYEYGLLRFNQYYISTKTAFYEYFTKLEIEKRIEFGTSIARNFAYRTVRIFSIPIEIDKPKFSSASQINFMHIAPYTSDREGTSTGLFAGFLYFFPTPLNILFLLIYCGFLMIIINNVSVLIPKKLSLLGMAFFLYWKFVLFEGPIDFLLIFDDSFLILVLYFIYFF